MCLGFYPCFWARLGKGSESIFIGVFWNLYCFACSITWTLGFSKMNSFRRESIVFRLLWIYAFPPLTSLHQLFFSLKDRSLHSLRTFLEFLESHRIGVSLAIGFVIIGFESWLKCVIFMSFILCESYRFPSSSVAFRSDKISQI